MTAHSNDRAGRLAFLEEILGSLIFRSTQYWWNPVLGQGWGAFGQGDSSEAVRVVSAPDGHCWYLLLLYLYPVSDIVTGAHLPWHLNSHHAMSDGLLGAG